MIIPSSRQLDGLIRVFVKTGPGYDDCGEAFDVGVDLIQAGMSVSITRENLKYHRHNLDF